MEDIRMIDLIKLSKYFLTRYRKNCRNSVGLYDQTILLLIHNHKKLGKADVCEILFESRSATKSSLDRPFDRLLNEGLILKECNEINRDNENCRTLYRLSDEGLMLMNECRLVS